MKKKSKNKKKEEREFVTKFFVLDRSFVTKNLTTKNLD